VWEEGAQGSLRLAGAVASGTGDLADPPTRRRSVSTVRPLLLALLAVLGWPASAQPAAVAYAVIDDEADSLTYAVRPLRPDAPEVRLATVESYGRRPPALIEVSPSGAGLAWVTPTVGQTPSRLFYAPVAGGPARVLGTFRDDHATAVAFVGEGHVGLRQRWADALCSVADPVCRPLPPPRKGWTTRAGPVGAGPEAVLVWGSTPEGHTLAVHDATAGTVREALPPDPDVYTADVVVRSGEPFVAARLRAPSLGLVTLFPGREGTVPRTHPAGSGVLGISDPARWVVYSTEAGDVEGHAHRVTVLDVETETTRPTDLVTTHWNADLSFPRGGRSVLVAVQASGEAWSTDGTAPSPAPGPLLSEPSELGRWPRRPDWRPYPSEPQGPRALVRVDLETGDAVLVSPGPVASYVFADPAVYYVAPDGDAEALYRADVEGGGGGGPDLVLQVGPDERVLAYACAPDAGCLVSTYDASASRYRIVRAATGRPPVEVARVEGAAGESALPLRLLPDGTGVYAVYRREERTRRRWPVTLYGVADGGGPWLIVEGGVVADAVVVVPDAP
jgi:hypothetical protein